MSKEPELCPVEFIRRITQPPLFPRPSRVVEAAYRTSIENFMRYFYKEKKMSSIEIQEMLNRNIGIKISRQIIWKWAKRFGIVRNPKKAFRLAVRNRGTFLFCQEGKWGEAQTEIPW